MAENRGYVVAWSTLKYTWNEERDYLWPIPADQRVLTGGLLTQNPGSDRQHRFRLTLSQPDKIKRQ